jgi:hypothetical protein
MHSHELLREVFDKASPKQVAADLGLSLSMIYKWAEPPDHASGSGASNPLDRIEALIKSTGDERIIQWICQKGGGFFIRNPKIHNSHPDFLIPATNEIIQEFADLLAVVASAAADNHISPPSASCIVARRETSSACARIRRVCIRQGSNGRGSFSPPARRTGDSADGRCPD